MQAMPKVAVPAPVVQVPVQVKPPTVDDPLHAVLTVGVVQVAPLQYSDPETLPAPLHAPPDTAVAPPEQKAPAGAEKPLQAPPMVPTGKVVDAIQDPDAEQVNPPAVPVPVHAVPMVGVLQLAPLQ
jgi:hypothetical protein